jgi:JAB domain-containing protein similar to deubiquitination enzymes
VRIRLAHDQVQKLKPALERAGTKEIGGQLFGEQLAPSDFRITELTIQARRGSFARFIVDLLQAARDAIRFFDRTEHRYTRFNYIGEWHSHPSFEISPSATDAQTMIQLVTDTAFRGSFAILIIVRLDGEILSAGAWLFDPQGTAQAIDLETSHEQ